MKKKKKQPKWYIIYDTRPALEGIERKLRFINFSLIGVASLLILLIFLVNGALK